MVQQREEFSLSLSLSFSGSSDHEHKLTNTNNNNNNQTAHFSSPLELNLMPSSTSNFPSPGPETETCTLSSLSGNKMSLIREESNNNEDVMECSRSEDQEDGDNCRKKLRLSKDQVEILEESFKEHSTLNPKQKIALAKRLSLRPRQVEVWFQNRRARTKLRQTEVDCQFLKRCCQTLMEENKKLQSEVQELRAFNLSPQFSMQMIPQPPTTFTLCPSCEHFAVPLSATTSSVCPSTMGAEPPQVPAMSTITIDSISTCGPPTGLDRENQMAQTLFL